MGKRITWIVTIIIVALSAPAASQCTSQELLGTGLAADDWFGFGMTMRGDMLVVGAPQHDVGSVDRGAAYVFLRGATWEQDAKIVPGPGGTRFGTELDTDGGRIIGSDTGRILVYVDTINGWELEATLAEPPGFDCPGSCTLIAPVAIDGDVLAIGSPNEDFEDDDDLGAVHIYRRDIPTGDWLEEAVLVPTLDGANARFGSSVDLQGNVLVAGSIHGKAGGLETGNAYVFRYDPVRGQWDQEQKLTPGLPISDAWMGVSVALDGNVAVVGARNDDTAGTAAGSAFVFRDSGTTWVREQRLAPGDTAAIDFFGDHVAVSGDTVVVGSIGNDAAGFNGGAAYVFRDHGGTWTEEAQLHFGVPASGIAFGQSVAVAGDTVAAGAYAGSTGTARVFTELIGPSTWSDLGGALNGAAGTPQLRGIGVPCDGADLGLELSAAAPTSMAWLVVGVGVLNASFKGGTLVPTADIVIGSVGTGPGSFTVAAPWPAGAFPGTSFVFQWWIADGAGPVGFAASNAVSIATP